MLLVIGVLTAGVRAEPITAHQGETVRYELLQHPSGDYMGPYPAPREIVDRFDVPWNYIKWSRRSGVHQVYVINIEALYPSLKPDTGILPRSEPEVSLLVGTGPPSDEAGLRKVVDFLKSKGAVSAQAPGGLCAYAIPDKVPTRWFATCKEGTPFALITYGGACTQQRVFKSGITLLISYPLRLLPESTEIADAFVRLLQSFEVKE